MESPPLVPSFALPQQSSTLENKTNKQNKMNTQKTITIGGKKYDASRLRKLPASELNGGDMVAVTVDGLQVAYRSHGHAVAILNFGAVRREDSLGGIVALLSV